MKHAIVLLLAPDSLTMLSKPAWECDIVRTISLITSEKKARFILDLSPVFSGTGPDDRIAFISLNHCKAPGDTRLYLSVYIDPGHTELIGLYENVDISFSLGDEHGATTTYEAEEILINSDDTQPFTSQSWQADPATFQFQVEKNNLILLSGAFSCTMRQEGRACLATGRFKCWKA